MNPRIGVAGLIHGHVGGLVDAASKVQGAILVAVADNTPLMDNYKDKFQRSYADWREMLEAEEFDLLIVTSDNIESSDIAVKALGKGIPCLVEKAMAANAGDADRMLAAAAESGKTLMINWPLAWSPWLWELKKRLEADEIGRPFHLRFRIGHHGPKEIGCDQWFVGWLYDEARNGGGAIADFGCYGAALSAYLFGLPETVFAVRHNATKPEGEVPDDHAIMTLKYPKLTVSLEATWATFGFDTGPNPVVHGKTGTLAVEGPKIVKYVAGKASEELPVPAMTMTNPVAYLLACIEKGTQPEGILNAELAADACRILDAAVKSSATGCAERV